MTGTELFKHAFGMIERNFGTAMRISAVLFVISLGLQFVPSVWSMTNPDLMFSLGITSFMALSYLPSLVAMVLGAWVAVAWHRYVLLEEDPGGWIPNFHGPEVLQYILWIILLILIYFLMLIPLFLVGALAIPGIESGHNPSAGMMVLFVVVLFATLIAAVLVFTRLSTCLVSRAVSQRLSLSQAWSATRGSNWPIILCLLIVFGFLIVFSIVVGILMAVIGVAAMVVIIPVYVLFTWSLMFFQISLMTTLYGHYIEGRGLVA